MGATLKFTNPFDIDCRVAFAVRNQIQKWIPGDMNKKMNPGTKYIYILFDWNYLESPVFLNS